MAYDLTEGQFDPPASKGTIDDLCRNVEGKLPGDYLEFLSENNGGEGFVGENYIVLWQAEDLADFNREYEVSKYAPGIFLFGSDGGGEAYGFDIEDPAVPIVRVPFIGLDRRYAVRFAENFEDFFGRLAGVS